MCTTLEAQQTATASLAANIITPIGLTKTTDLNFGNLAVSASTGGIAILSPGGIRSTGGAGGVTLPSNTGPVAAGSFVVSGMAGYSFALILPSSSTISNGSNAIVMDGFTSTPSLTGVLSSSGTQTINVGATIHIAAGQPAGSYTNAIGLPVTVNYN